MSRRPREAAGQTGSRAARVRAGERWACRELYRAGQEADIAARQQIRTRRTHSLAAAVPREGMEEGEAGRSRLHPRGLRPYMRAREHPARPCPGLPGRLVKPVHQPRRCRKPTASPRTGPRAGAWMVCPPTRRGYRPQLPAPVLGCGSRITALPISGAGASEHSSGILSVSIRKQRKSDLPCSVSLQDAGRGCERRRRRPNVDIRAPTPNCAVETWMGPYDASGAAWSARTPDPAADGRILATQNCDATAWHARPPRGTMPMQRAQRWSSTTTFHSEKGSRSGIGDRIESCWAD
jgi:hypothetical protein